MIVGSFPSLGTRHHELACLLSHPNCSCSSKPSSATNFDQHSLPHRLRISRVPPLHPFRCVCEHWIARHIPCRIPAYRPVSQVSGRQLPLAYEAGGSRSWHESCTRLCLLPALERSTKSHKVYSLSIHPESALSPLDFSFFHMFSCRLPIVVECFWRTCRRSLERMCLSATASSQLRRLCLDAAVRVNLVSPSINVHFFPTNHFANFQDIIRRKN